jgi:hypothetical protein
MGWTARAAVQYSPAPVARRAHTKPSPVFHLSSDRSSRVTSNVGQSYPYSSETEADRAARIDAIAGAQAGLADKLAAETTPLDAQDRWWTWKCPTAGCKGILHAAGYARDLHAVYVVCDGTCGKTFLR